MPGACLLLAAVVMQYGTLFGREPGSALGCGLLALKLLETEQPRDARVGIGFAGFVLMSALLFAQTLAFTVGVSLILILLLAALVSLQPAQGEPRHPLRTELRVGAILLACGLPLAAAGFMLVPRLSTPLWGGKDRTAEGRTGLNDSMEPGALTELLIDDSPAFRVHFDATPPLPQQRYFRAIVLSDFNGATWTRSRRSDFLRPEEAERDGTPVDYVITLEPTDRRWLPALDLPFVAPSGARFSADRELIAYDAVVQPREYRVRSSSRYTLGPVLSADERAHALALPDRFDPKTRALAAEWRAQNVEDVGVVRAALDLFHASFTYTLNPPPLGRDSIDDFLFATRKGFCEHYASAFVVLMRSAGIPARVVTGYQGGWWSESGGYLLVRNSDAHAWAEVWMAGRGWVRVDPTAAVSPARIELGAAAANDASGLGSVGVGARDAQPFRSRERLVDAGDHPFRRVAPEGPADAVRRQRRESGRSSDCALDRACHRAAARDDLGDARIQAAARRCARRRLGDARAPPRARRRRGATERRSARSARPRPGGTADIERGAERAGERLRRAALRCQRTGARARSILHPRGTEFSRPAAGQETQRRGGGATLRVCAASWWV